ncbi:MAG: Cadmium, cobalt and zinc/H(+)-K(+) antiporter [Acidimicrobiales bacterium]|nr:Cadmium, cobalt and zinc/H(+)-K(+) antiporter [Acidimicrobiales bacterium]
MAAAGQDHHLNKRRGRALRVSLVLNALLLVVQASGAIVFGSLALLADSAHQLTDVVGLTIALGARRLALRPHSSTYTFGFKRAELLGALVNAALLVAASGWIIYEAIERLGDPPEIDGIGVIILALAGLAVNAGSAWWLGRVSGENLNIRAAMVHLAADAAGSAAVLAAGVAAALWDAYWVDPAASMVIALLVIWTAWGLVTDASRILLEGTPPTTDPEAITRVIAAHDSVEEVHHVHLWSLDAEDTFLSAHIVVDQANLHDAQRTADELKTLLKDRFGVDHTTFELECHPCAEPEH